MDLESNALSDLTLINFMLSKIYQHLKQRWLLILDNDKKPDFDLYRRFIERETRVVEESECNKVEYKFNFAKKASRC